MSLKLLKCLKFSLLIFALLYTGPAFCQEYKVNADEYFQLGVSYGQTGKFDKSAEVFKKLAVDLPNNPKIHFFLGKSYLSLEKLDLAKEELNKALALDANLYYAMDDLATINLIEQKYDQAKALLEKSIALAPKNYIAYYNLGLVFIGLNDLPQAKNQCEILKKLNPKAAELLEGAIKEGKLSGKHVVVTGK